MEIGAARRMMFPSVLGSATGRGGIVDEQRAVVAG